MAIIETSLDGARQKSESCSLLYRQNGETVGYAMCCVRGAPPDWHIISIEVEEPHRRRGIGTKLLRKVVEMGRSRGLKRATLHVRPDNSAAIALYDKMGFRVKERVTAHYGEGGDAYRMERPI